MKIIEVFDFETREKVYLLVCEECEHSQEIGKSYAEDPRLKAVIESSRCYICMDTQKT